MSGKQIETSDEKVLVKSQLTGSWLLINARVNGSRMFRKSSLAVVVVVLTVLCIRVSNSDADIIGIIRPAYSNPQFSPDGPAMWNALLETAQRTDRNFQIRAVLNPDSGPGETANQQQFFTDYFGNGSDGLAAQFLSEGGQLVGYVSTDFGCRDIVDVKNDIDAYLIGIYAGKMSGIFLDEFFNDASDLPYYQEIYDHIRSRDSQALIIANAGSSFFINTTLTDSQATALISPLDTLVSFEGTEANYRASTGNDRYQPLTGQEAITNPRLAHFTHTSATIWDESLLSLAEQRNAAWFFATPDVFLDLDVDNPWDNFNESHWNGMVNSVIAANTVLLGDVNQDESVNFLDISPFILILSNGGYLEEADTNQDSEVNFLDISPFIVLLSSQ